MDDGGAAIFLGIREDSDSPDPAADAEECLPMLELPRLGASTDLSASARPLSISSGAVTYSPPSRLGPRARSISSTYVATWNDELTEKEASLREHELHILRAEKKLKKFYESVVSWRDALSEAAGAVGGAVDLPQAPQLPPPIRCGCDFLGGGNITPRKGAVEGEEAAGGREGFAPEESPQGSVGGPKRTIPLSEADQHLISLLSPSAAPQSPSKEFSHTHAHAFGHEEHAFNREVEERAALVSSTEAAAPLWTDEERNAGGSSSPEEIDDGGDAADQSTPLADDGSNDGEGSGEDSNATLLAKEEAATDDVSMKYSLSRSSLFGDEEEASVSSNSTLLSKIIQREAQPMVRSTPNVGSIQEPEEAPLLAKRVLSTDDISACIVDDDYHKPAEHPEELLKIAGGIEGLKDLLTPARSLVFKFSAIVELAAPNGSSATPAKGKPFSSRSRRSASKGKDGREAKVPTKCLVLLFDDIACICTRAKVMFRFPLLETWLRTESLFGTGKHGAPFRFVTPERQVVAYLAEEGRVEQLQAVFSATVAKRLERFGRMLGEPPDVSRRRLRFEFASGAVYDGEWKAAKFNGKGTYSLPSGDVYSGGFLNGKQHGNGELQYSDNRRYVGAWRHGKRHGKGTLHFGDTDEHAIKFVGSWNENVQHGEGELHLLSGQVLKTIWRLGQPTYPAVLHWASGSRYIGDLSEDYQREGFGICIYSNCDRYYGSWAMDKRHGRGMFVTSKGTEYNGEWQDDLMEGKGTLRFSGDESTFYGKFSGDWNDVLDVNGNFRLSKKDDVMRTLRMSTNRGDKWDCFFSMRLLNDELNEQAAVLNEMINRRRATAEEGGDPLGGGKGEGGSLRDDFQKILYCRNHPLGKILAEFASIFEALYYRPEEHYTHLATAVDDLQAFMHLMSGSFIRKFLGCHGLMNEDCTEVLHAVLFPEIYSTLFSLYNLKYEEQNSKIQVCIQTLLEQSLVDRMIACGVDERYHKTVEEMIESDIKLKAIDLDPSADLTPFQGAVNALRELSVQQTVGGKLSCIKQAATRVETLLKKLMDNFGADEFLPMFCFAMLHAGMPALYSECAFMEDFMEDDLRFSVYGYMLAQLQVAAGFFTNPGTLAALEAHRQGRGT